MPYLRSSSLGADETVGSPVALEVLTRLDDRTKRIEEHQRVASVRWKWQTIAAVAGAVFAAVRLGWIAVPTYRQYRSKKLGELGGETREANPRRRRRRTRRR